jgi:hypothetical protein
MSELIGTVSLSIDDDGFLRRECPHCGREFKWLHGDGGEEMPAGGYHCPYCGGRSEDGWWTRPQLAVIGASVGEYAQEAVYRGFKKLEGRPSKHVKFKANRPTRKPLPDVPDEPNDMRRVDFSCHPKEPVKVLESWTGATHCLMCGRPTE